MFDHEPRPSRRFNCVSYRRQYVCWGAHLSLRSVVRVCPLLTFVERRVIEEQVALEQPADAISPEKL